MQSMYCRVEVESNVEQAIERLARPANAGPEERATLYTVGEIIAHADCSCPKIHPWPQWTILMPGRPVLVGTRHLLLPLRSKSSVRSFITG
jgi:hypothetical protein